MCNEYNTFLELMLGDKANNKSRFSLWVTKEILWKQFFLRLNVQLYCVAKILKKNSSLYLSCSTWSIISVCLLYWLTKGQFDDHLVENMQLSILCCFWDEVVWLFFDSLYYEFFFFLVWHSYTHTHKLHNSMLLLQVIFCFLTLETSVLKCPTNYLTTKEKHSTITVSVTTVWRMSMYMYFSESVYSMSDGPWAKHLQIPCLGFSGFDSGIRNTF